MSQRRIEHTTSRTAEMTCLSRAASSLECNPHYHSDDHLAVRLLPSFFRLLLHIPCLRALFMKMFAPAGIYEYVIARTKYIDAVFQQALAQGFDQVLLFGAGFDTRALRFGSAAPHTRIFELDAPHTQRAKIQQYKARRLTVPPNVVFVAMDFDKEALPDRLDAAGFRKGQRCLFVLEGLLMYLESASVDATFHTISEFAGSESAVVFDYVRASVLRHGTGLYGEEGATEFVSKAGEQWRFGLEPAEIASFLAKYGCELRDHQCAHELEESYFRDADGRLVGRVNGTHCLVTAAFRQGQV